MEWVILSGLPFLSKLSVNQENHVAVINLANDAGSFAERALAKKKQGKADVNLNWICPTSNIAERLFSTVRHFFNDNRKKLPTTNESRGADIPQGKQKTKNSGT